MTAEEVSTDDELSQASKAVLYGSGCVTLCSLSTPSLLLLGQIPIFMPPPKHAHTVVVVVVVVVDVVVVDYCIIACEPSSLS